MLEALSAWGAFLGFTCQEGAEAWSEAGVFRGLGADGSYYRKAVPVLFLRASCPREVPPRGGHNLVAIRQRDTHSPGTSQVPKGWKTGQQAPNG